jgi:hypothetical protein
MFNLHSLSKGLVDLHETAIISRLLVQIGHRARFMRDLLVVLVGEHDGWSMFGSFHA